MTCGARGPEDSPFVIVGESPGSRELATGLPFSGPSGVMLGKVLQESGFASLGINPYIINAFNCYPAEKNVKSLERATRACNGRVQEQLSRHPRKVILALGVAASWAVTGDYNIRIMRDRGEVRQVPCASSGAVLTVHPAFLMRQGNFLSAWKKDVKSSVRLLRGENLNTWIEPTWAVIDTPSQYAQIVDEYIEEGGLVTGDVETTSLHWMRGEVLCFGITRDGDHVDVITERMLYAMPQLTKRLMEAPNIRWNWQNGQFDIRWFRYLWKILARVDEDTMLMNYTLNENRGHHDLDFIAQQQLGAPRHKEGMSHYYKEAPYYSLRNAPVAELYKYNAFDISKTHKAYFPLREQIRADWNAINEYRTILIPAVEFLVNMQLYGVKADVDRIKANIELHETELKGIRHKINSEYAQKHLGHDINLNSPIQVKTLIYGKMGMGNMTMSTDENALIQAKRTYEHPIIDLILDHREVAKRKGTYVSNILADPERKKNPLGFIQSDGRVHADYGLHKTATGRLAGSDPNMLNQPRGPLIRSQFKAGQGKIFVEVDLNQAELRSLALMSGDPLLMEIYTKNEVSIHDVTTGKFFATKAEIAANPEVARRVRAQLLAGAQFPDDKLYAEAKMRGKAVNFGIVYGREAFSLSREFNIPIAEAQRWIDDWLDLYSGAAQFIDWCRRAPLENRNLVTVFGRKKRVGAVGRDILRNLQNEFANFPHQSTASDIMLETAIEVQPVLAARWNAYIWNELYDAIYFECDASDDLLQESIGYIQDVIPRVARDRGLLRIPFLGDAKIGYDWGHMHDWKGSINASIPITV
jgi:DNA polymerase-1